MPRAPRSGLTLGPRAARTGFDHFVHHGRHFGRTVHAMSNVIILLQNGLTRTSDAAEINAQVDLESMPSEERVEHLIFEEMVKVIPLLEREISQADGGERIRDVGKKIQDGVNHARSEDAKGLKSHVLTWIRPLGDVSDLEGANKSKRGFKNDITGRLLCPAELDWDDLQLRADLRTGRAIISPDSWPIFLYENYTYDPADAWLGLLRSQLLVTAFKYIFTSPSSVNKEGAKATRKGNAAMHGMRHATRGAVAYVAMQVRFALSSSEIFTRTDYAMQSELFFNTLLSFLWEDSEKDEVSMLLAWYDGQVFNTTITSVTVPTSNSALAKIKAQRAAAAAAAGGEPGVLAGASNGDAHASAAM